MTRYPFAPLAALMALSEHLACQQLRVSGRTAQEYRRDGVSALVADRLAVRAGFHPAEVWPSWWDEHTSLERRCDECETSYEPRHSRQRFCSARCRTRVKMRRYREGDAARERTREAARAYYAECRGTVLLKKRLRREAA